MQTAQIGLRIIPTPVVSKPDSLILLDPGNCELPYIPEHILLVLKLVIKASVVGKNLK